MSPCRAADAPRLALGTPSQHTVVARENRLGDRPLARNDDRDELARAAAHGAKRPIAALEETLQLAEPSGLAHHLERGADEALVGELVERLAEQGNDIDLALAVLGTADLAIGRGVRRVGDCRRVRAERLDHGPVEAFRQNVEPLPPPSGSTLPQRLPGRRDRRAHGLLLEYELTPRRQKQFETR